MFKADMDRVEKIKAEKVMLKFMKQKRFDPDLKKKRKNKRLIETLSMKDGPKFTQK